MSPLDFSKFGDSSALQFLTELSESVESSGKTDAKKFIIQAIVNAKEDIRRIVEIDLYRIVLRRFEEISSIPLSKSWAARKRFMALRAAGSGDISADDFPLKKPDITDRKRITYGPRKHKARSWNQKYYLRVRNSEWLPIKVENIHKFGQATGFLRNEIVNALATHSNTPAFKAVIELTQMGHVMYNFELSDKFFYKSYPLCLDLILGKEGRGGLLTLNANDRAMLQMTIKSIFKSILSSAATLSGGRFNPA